MNNMTRLRLQRRWGSIKSLFCTWESVLVWSALVAPLLLAISLGFDFALTITSFALFLLTMTVLEMKKERDKWRESYELNRALLEEERKKKNNNINNEIENC